MQHTNKKRRHDVAQESTDCHQHNAQPSIPARHGTNRFAFVRFLHHINDVCLAHRTVAQEKEHDRHIEGKSKHIDIGLRVYAQGHFLAVDHKQAEDLPNASRHRQPQQGTAHTAAQRNHGKVLAQFPRQLLTAGAQSQEDARFAALFAEKEACSIGCKHAAADDRQRKDHRHLFAAVAALRQHIHDRWRTHHQAVRRNQEH